MSGSRGQSGTWAGACLLKAPGPWAAFMKNPPDMPWVNEQA